MKKAVVGPATATPELIDICCTALAMELAAPVLEDLSGAPVFPAILGQDGVFWNQSFPNFLLPATA